jgi:hypothetical protein
MQKQRKWLVIYLALLSSMVGSLSFLYAGELCEFSITDCPEAFNNKTINVPLNVVAMSAFLKACDTKIQLSRDSAAPASIIFVIDHSGSMMGVDTVNHVTTAGNDIDGYRYKVTRDLLDTLYKVNSNIDVGLVVFREVLYFDKNNNDQVVAYPNGTNDNQSYYPLTKLSSSQTGIGALKKILETREVSYTDSLNTSHPEPFNYVDLVYKPTFPTQGYTNITLAFNAAKKAMEKSENPKERQFIIFLSDGIAQLAVTTADLNEYQRGAGMPTTFTIYLSESSTSVPSQLMTMTNNIRDNGYSTSNRSSAAWALQSDYSELMGLINQKIIEPIIVITNNTSTSVTVNDIISTTKVESTFVFNDKFPISKDETPFTIKINYKITDTSNVIRDSNFTTMFTVKRQAGVPSPGVILNCWNQAVISLHHNGNQITEIDETMNTLELRFNPLDQKYTNVSLLVQNSFTDPKESENFTLTQQNTGIWTRSFSNEIKDQPVQNDSRFQHKMNDSMIIIYRNPKIPLDTIRVAYPIKVKNTISIRNAFYYDNNADGYIDSIALDGNVKLSSGDLEMFRQKIQLPEFRNFTIKALTVHSSGVGLTVAEGRNGAPLTNIQTGEKIQILSALLPGSGVIAGSTVDVTDKVAPVINSAELRYGESGDSLAVTFSENVANITSNSAFLFRKPDNTSYRVTIVPNGIKVNNTVTFKVVKIDGANFAESGDSIWINFEANVADIRENSQNNKNNRRVLLSVKQLSIVLIPKIVNNPYIPGELQSGQGKNKWPDMYLEKIYKKYSASLPDDGMIIFVEPKDRVPNGTWQSYNEIVKAEMSLYDVAKNVIIQDIPMYFDNEHIRFVYVWDGFNRYGRMVSSGTYTLKCKLTKNDGKVSYTQPVYAGVKRIKIDK